MVRNLVGMCWFHGWDHIWFENVDENSKIQNPKSWQL
jgi:hypothetical protein